MTKSAPALEAKAIAKNVLEFIRFADKDKRFCGLTGIMTLVEECYLLEGEVVVESKDGKKVNFGKGDFVTFPKGLSCIWDIKKLVSKHYNFR